MEDKSRRFHTNEDYTIGWVCARSLEATAAIYMLEERYMDISNPKYDDNVYILGRIARHNIVIAISARSRIGNVGAATVAAQMVSTFPNIRIILLVGVGSGIPQKVRLGDIVVSCPNGTHPGVAQWDNGTAYQGGRFQQSKFLFPPSTMLLRTLSEIKKNTAEHRAAMNSIIDHLRIHFDLPKCFTHPGVDKDILYESTYEHVDRVPDSCQACDKDKIIKRPPREDMMIHYGLIVSTNQVVRDAQVRDQMHKDFNNDILCITTEAAGLTNTFPSIVIRGIDNYADSHSNYSWQYYAAMRAAAFARIFLSTLQVVDVDTSQGSFILPLHSAPSPFIEDREEYGNSSQVISNPPTTQPHIEIQDVYIAVMGVTGAGKSSLISMCTDKIVKIGHNLKSCTTDVEDIAFMLNDRICVHLIDTPGFDDTFRSDVQVLQDLAHWFSRSFQEGTRLSGMIYLHRITDVRMTGSALRNLVMFQKLCGENAYSSVVLATTMWDLVKEATGEQREQELIESDEYWGYMHNKGSRIFRLAQTRKSCLEIIRYILSLDSTVVLELQDEIVNQGHQIEETKAGLQLNEDILRERKKYQAELQVMKEQMHETMALQNDELQRIFREEYNKLEENIRLKEEEQAKLKQDLKEVQARKDHELDEFKRQLADMEGARKRYDDNNRRMEEFLSIKQKEAYKELINGNQMEVYKPQDEEEELLKGGQKEAYIRPANGYTSNGEQNMNSDDTPLHAAVRNRKPDVVRFLLDNGGNIKSKDKLGNTPLHLATMTGQANIAKMLLDRRANISERNNSYNTPLHLAVLNGQMDTAKLLLIRQADIEMGDIQDNTPLHLAAWGGREGIAKLLLKGGAKIEVKNKSGQTPLHLAALNGKVDVVKLLRKGGADVEAKDSNGNTPLHLASLAGKVDVTKLLLGQKTRWWSGW